MTFFHSSKTKYRKALDLALLAAGGAMFAAGCRSKPTDPAQPAGNAVQPASVQTTATQVSVSGAARKSISSTIQVTGSLNALHDVTVGVKSSGKIVAVYAREGDLVNAGQVVAQQDTTDLQSQLDQARANLLSAQTKLSQAQLTFKDSQTNLRLTDEQTKSAVQLAQAGLDAAKEQAAVIKQGARTQERAQSQQALDAAKADVSSAQADIDSAKLEQTQTRRDLKRYQSLARQDAISQQQLDQAQTAADAADSHYNMTMARFNSLTAKQNAAQQSLSLVQEGSRPEDIRRAQSVVEQARQQVVSAVSNRGQVALRRVDVETAQAGIAAAQAGIRQAEAAGHISEQAFKDSAIRSPIAGVVAERKVEPGMQVSTVKPDVMRIVALDSIYFDAQLPETQYSQVQFGQAVNVSVDALPGRTFRGSVSKIFPIASTTGRGFTVRIGISNEARVLRPQMFARGVITLATHPNAIVVPRDALLDYNYGAGTAHLLLATNNVAHDRQVRTGIATPNFIEIVSGLNQGEKVITSGQAQIRDKDKIQVIAAQGNLP